MIAANISLQSNEFAKAAVETNGLVFQMYLAICLIQAHNTQTCIACMPLYIVCKPLQKRMSVQVHAWTYSKMITLSLTEQSLLPQLVLLVSTVAGVLLLMVAAVKGSRSWLMGSTPMAAALLQGPGSVESGSRSMHLLSTLTGSLGLLTCEASSIKIHKLRNQWGAHLK